MARTRRLTLGLALAAALTACTTTYDAEWFASAPPGLDPTSPKVIAKDVAFDRLEIRVVAGRQFVLVLENLDGLPHNLSVYADPAHRQKAYDGVVFDGPATRWLVIPALAPGTYAFVCDIHPIPSMTGVLQAG